VVAPTLGGELLRSSCNKSLVGAGASGRVVRTRREVGGVARWRLPRYARHVTARTTSAKPVGLTRTRDGLGCSDPARWGGRAPHLQPELPAKIDFALSWNPSAR
jgi:hypothetical protein